MRGSVKMLGMHLLRYSNIQFMKQATTQFDFAAQPKVTALKAKYRDREEDRLDGTNLMNDPRVVRGNTYAAIIANKNQVQPPPLKKTLKQTKKKPPQLKERRINFDTGFEPTTPRAVSGREHFNTQTQPFVETLRDKPIQYEKEAQTDLFLDRPVQRQFNPMAEKTGVDRVTQVDENDPELFNFDYEVQPILEALLNKVLETSRMELFEEGEMQEKEREKIEYEKRRHTKLAEAQKLEANENRLREEYERRQLQYRKSKDQEVFAEKKVISRILSKQYLKNLQDNTEMILEHQGFFRSPLQLNIFQEFVPWLYQQVLTELNEQSNNRKFAESLIVAAEREMTQTSSQFMQKKERERKEQLQRRQEEIQRKKELKRKKAEEEAEKKRRDEEKLQEKVQPQPQ